MKNNGLKNRRQAPEDSESQGNEMNNDLHELFLDELADVLNAEIQLTKALPKMAKAAQSEDLAEAFTSHLKETENHANRIREIFESLDEKVKNKTCKAMKGLIEEGSDLMQELKGTSVLDAGLIAAGQKVEHYEMASYGTLHAWAEQMGHSDAAQLLQDTLEEEKAADEKLTEIAQESANKEPA